MREDHRETNTGTVSKATLGKLLGDGVECIIMGFSERIDYIVQELCESPGVRPGLSVLTSLLVSVDVKNY